MQPVLEAMRNWGEAYKKRFLFEDISKNTTCKRKWCFTICGEQEERFYRRLTWPMK